MLVQEFPETAPNPIGFAYITLLTHMMDRIGDTTLSIYKEDVISLHHDRCDYDAVLQEQFMGLVAEDSNFKHRTRFASLTSETWQDCLLLQPADLIAYENFKESMRVHSNRDRRGSLAAIIDLDAVSGRSKGFTQQGIREMKSIIGGLGEDAKKTLFAAARIR